MVQLFSILGIIVSALLVFTQPWIAGLFYSLVSVLQPQYVWFWVFDDIPIFKITAGLAIIGLALKLLRNEVSLATFREPIAIALVCLWAIFHVSHILSPYPPARVGARADIVLGTMDIIVVMFLVLLAVLDRKEALWGILGVFILTAIYYTWWSNKAYVTGDWNKFFFGRLNGPRDSPYQDGNLFSILFVIGMPFIIFGIFFFRNVVVRLALAASVPFVWHALVLCASRGALISTAVGTLAAAALLRSRSLNLVLIAGFIVFMVYQGGPMIERALETTNENQAGEETEAPINPRILSWQVGIGITLEYPLLGAGPQRFINASADLFPGKSPHVAHNTLLNFSSNTGVFAGFIYLFFFFRSFRIFRENRKIITESDRLEEYVNNATLCALLGYFVGAIFLDMIVFEPFYFVLLLVVINHRTLLQKQINRLKSPS